MKTMFCNECNLNVNVGCASYPNGFQYFCLRCRGNNLTNKTSESTCQKGMYHIDENRY